MPRQAAGILMYREAAAGHLEVLLAHPGGPLWTRKDLGAWTVPKGQFGDDEAPLAAAKREFEEEMGSPPTANAFHELGAIKQPGGKIVHVFAGRGDFDTASVKSNLFSMEWPPKSGRTAQFPEVDRAAWFSIEEARRKILKGQEPFLDRLLTLLEPSASAEGSTVP
jgi:predicted NUDIX family NTP pyrophosphohydrolase